MEFKATDYKPNEIFKFIRQNGNITQKELGEKMNKSLGWVKDNEQGINRYFFEDLIKMAKICNIEIIFKSK